MVTEFQKLAADLIDVSRRRETAEKMARALGAEDLIIFVRDPEVDVSLPVHGFAQTLPQAALWHNFVENAIKKGQFEGELPHFENGQNLAAAAIAVEDGTVMVFLGGAPDLDRFSEDIGFLTKLLGEIFRGEHRTSAADAKVRTLKKAAAQTRELAAKLETARAELQQALIEAESAGRLKDEFLATVSHELRTPLNAILGWARMLQTRALDDDTTEKAIATIERNARSQMQLVADLLDISTIVSGKFQLEPHLLDPSLSVLSVIDSIRPATEAKNIDLKTSIDPAAKKIFGDPDKLQQIVWNLLSNAVKFTPPGGIVEVSIRSGEGEQTLIEVKDSGIGIDQEFLPFVFERFRQSDGSKSRRYGGLGLGLAIVQQLTELHGGTVRAESEGTGKGAVFTLSFPALKDSVPVAAGKNVFAKKPVTSSDELSGLRVLFVDDEPDAREMMKVILSSSGAKVTEATSAAEALRELMGGNFDIVISDIAMPDEDGYSLIKKIRRLPFGDSDHLPAVALTNYSGSEDRKRAIRSGFDLHIPKPVNPAELVRTVALLRKDPPRDH